MRIKKYKSRCGNWTHKFRNEFHQDKSKFNRTSEKEKVRGRINNVLLDLEEINTKYI